MPSWSPDGERIAFRGVSEAGEPFAASESVYVVPAAGGRPRDLAPGRHLLLGPSDGSDVVDWRHDGGHALAWDGRTRCCAWSPGAGRRRSGASRSTVSRPCSREPRSTCCAASPSGGRSRCWLPPPGAPPSCGARGRAAPRGSPATARRGRAARRASQRAGRRSPARGADPHLAPRPPARRGRCRRCSRSSAGPGASWGPSRGSPTWRSPSAATGCCDPTRAARGPTATSGSTRSARRGAGRTPRTRWRAATGPSPRGSPIPRGSPCTGSATAAS